MVIAVTVQSVIKRVKDLFDDLYVGSNSICICILAQNTGTYLEIRCTVHLIPRE